MELILLPFIKFVIFLSYVEFFKWYLTMLCWVVNLLFLIKYPKAYLYFPKIFKSGKLLFIKITLILLASLWSLSATRL